MPNLQELANTALARSAEVPAIEFEGRWVSWGKLRHIASELASALTGAHVKDRAPVALIARNRPAAIAALLGLIAQGRTISMIYPFQASAVIARDIRGLSVAAVVASREDFTDELLGALAESGVAAVAVDQNGATSLRQCDSAPAGGEGAPQIEVLTSGTTGPPKRFALSYELIERHFVANSSLVARAGADPASAPPFLLYFPLGNITGLYSTLPTLIHGLRVCLLQRFSLEAWLDYVKRYRPVHTGVPPSYVQQIIDADIAKEDLASIKMMGIGAAPLDPSTQAAFEQKYQIPLLLSYGATEFGGPVAAMTPELHAEYGQRKIGTVGRPFPNVQIRATDPETGCVLPAGQDGVLEIISPRIGPDWIRTSDLGRVDDDGFVFIAGRADGAIMRGGFKVLPETIERALRSHPAVSEAAVVGVPDRRLGQAPAAAIRLRPGVREPALADFEAHLRGQVLATHVPVHWKFVSDLPRTASLKVDRPAVARLFADAPSGPTVE